MDDKAKSPVPQGDDQNQKGTESYAAGGDASPVPARDDNPGSKGTESYPAEGK